MGFNFKDETKAIQAITKVKQFDTISHPLDAILLVSMHFDYTKFRF